MATEAQKKQFVKGCIIFSFQVYDEDDMVLRYNYGHEMLNRL